MIKIILNRFSALLTVIYLSMISTQCLAFTLIETSIIVNIEDESSKASVPVSTTISAAKSGNSAIKSRQQSLQAGNNTGFDFSGLMLNNEQFELANQKTWIPAKNGGAAGDGSLLFGDKLGFFATGNFVFGDHDRTSRVTGFDFDTLGFTVGADYKLTDEFFLGSAFQYAASDINFDRGGGGTEIDSYSVTVYSSYNHPTGFYLDGILRYGWNDYTQDRNYTALGQNLSAKADYDGIDYSASLSGGFNIALGGLSIRPYGRFEYFAVDIDSYQEKAKNSTAINSISILAVNQQNQQSIITALGVQANYAISTSFGIILPTLSAEWVHEYKNNSRTIRSELINIPLSPVITSKTDNPDRNYFNLSPGISTVLAHGVSGFINYEILLANHFLTQHTFNIGMRMEF